MMRAPELGSLWIVLERSTVLGHEEGDVIIVVGRVGEHVVTATPALTFKAFPDALTTLSFGFTCLNRKGLSFYPELWWQTAQDLRSGEICYRFVRPVT